MNLEDFVSKIHDFDSLSVKEKIVLFGWYLNAHKNKENFESGDVKQCFVIMHLEVPNVSTYLSRLASGKLASISKSKSKFKLLRGTRINLEKKYDFSTSNKVISALFVDLLDKIRSKTAKAFLEESINCYRVQAYRACIVMTWNLAFDHFLNWVLADQSRLNQFNSAIVIRYPKKTGYVVKNRTDFEEFKEREIIDICSTAKIISKSLSRLMVQKLDRRNDAAHPSDLLFSQAQVDDHVTDLINNLVGSLKVHG
jgi:hypothetical protein